MSVVVDGGPVRPHVQAFADAIHELTGITHIMTYEGHQPTRDRALDIFATHEQGDIIAQYYIDHWRHYGGDYIIWRQRIWNPEIAPYWRDMADRGGITANHYDHVHVSFEPTGSANPIQEDDDMFGPNEMAALNQAKDAAQAAQKDADQVRKDLQKANEKLDRLIAKFGA